MASAAPQSPDFANGLFLTATNLGTTFGTAICGQIIEQVSLPMMYIVGFVMVLGSAVVFYMRYVSSKEKIRNLNKEAVKEVS